MSENPKNAWHSVYGITSEELQHAQEEVERRYGDILYAERPHSSGRRRASAGSRAAQFLPFAALTGFDSEIEKEGRYTERKRELSSEEIEELDGQLQLIRQKIKDMPQVRLEVFEEDPDKPGGFYRERTVRVRRIDSGQGVLVTDTGERIPFESIRTIQSTDGDYNREEENTGENNHEIRDI